VFLNGAILGMRKAEIRRKLDEIIAFSEIGEFIDTPVKRYSSGMYVRLAFAVAAHLDPEILIVDEVLAVGDAQFQHKCLNKIRALANGGRTVLFVSHNLTTVTSLCTSGVLLRQGQFVQKASAKETVELYISSGSHQHGAWKRNGASEQRDIWFESASLHNGTGSVAAEFDTDEPIVLKLRACVAKSFNNAQFAVRVTNREGIPIFSTCNTDEARRFVPIEPGPAKFTVRFPIGLLAPGRYSLQIAAHSPKNRLFDIIDDELSFVIHDSGSLAQLLRDDRLGVVNPLVHWETD
jgi:lipopolysaccharide transport system ATP-binding protein